MTINPKIMNLYKIPIQDKRFRTPMDPTTPSRNSGNIDQFINSQMAIPISTVSLINHTKINSTINIFNWIFLHRRYNHRHKKKHVIKTQTQNKNIKSTKCHFNWKCHKWKRDEWMFSWDYKTYTWYHES